MSPSTSHTQVQSPLGSWKYEVLEGELLRFEKRVDPASTQNILEASGPFWLLGMIRLRKGRILYTRAEGPLRPSEDLWGVYFPPFTIAETCFHGVIKDALALASAHPIAAVGPRNPVLFRLPSGIDFPGTLSAVARYLKKISGCQDISRSAQPSILSARMKSAIDSSYTSPCKLSEIARQIGRSAPQIARSFKQDFGISPVEYRNHLRTRVAAFNLLLGKGTVAEVGFRVGFSDLGRFYKSMKKTTSNTPGAYRRGSSKKK